MIDFITISLLILSIVTLCVVITFIFYSLYKHKEENVDISKDIDVYQKDLSRKYIEMMNMFNTLKVENTSNLTTSMYNADSLYTSNLSINSINFPSSNIFIQSSKVNYGITNSVKNMLSMNNSNMIINSNIFVDGLESSILSTSNVSLDSLSLHYHNSKVSPLQMTNDSFIINNSNNFHIYNTDKVVHSFKHNGDVYHDNNLTIDNCLYFGENSNNKICMNETKNEFGNTYINNPLLVDNIDVKKINLGKPGDYNTLYTSGSNIYYSDIDGNIFRFDLKSNV